MSGTFAACTIVGRLVRDAELKYTNSGMAICGFTVVTDHRVKKGDQWVDEPTYWNVNIFGKRGESVNQYLTKGKLVGVSGDAYEERWEKDGQKHSKLKVDAQEVTLLGGNERHDVSLPEGTSARREQASKDRAEGVGSKPTGDGFTDDIPF